MSRLVEGSKLLLKGCFLSLVLLISLEMCARIDDYISYGASPLRNYSLDDLKIIDTNGIRGRPNARFEKWQLNSLGFQGPETSLEKPQGRVRILVIGASETFGLYESPGRAYPAQLEQLLAQRLGCSVEVLNAALPGMSLPRIIQFCRYYLPKLQPDVVVYYPTPAGYLDIDPPTAIVSDTKSALRTERPQLRLVKRGWNWIKAALPASIQDQMRQREIAAAVKGMPEGWLYQEAPIDRVALFETHLLELVKLVEQHETKLVVATHANRFKEPLTSAEAQHLTAWRRSYPRAKEPVILAMERLINERIKRVGQSRSVLVADVSAAVAPEPDNFQDFSHFTDRGSALAAEAFAETILPLLVKKP